MGEVGRVPAFGRNTYAVIASPFRAWQSGPLTFMSLRGRSQRELTWQSSLRRYMGCRTRSAGLPRRCAPRNDKGGEWGARWGDAGFRAYHLVLSLRARLGRGNQVSSLLCHCEEGLEEN
jgi:hypothetical protein